MTELSKREQECLVRIAAGMGNREIGTDLGLAEDTVKSHVQQVYRKLAARNRAHAVWLGVQAGALEPKPPGRWSWAARPEGLKFTGPPPPPHVPALDPPRSATGNPQLNRFSKDST